MSGAWGWALEALEMKPECPMVTSPPPFEGKPVRAGCVEHMVQVRAKEEGLVFGKDCRVSFVVGRAGVVEAEVGAEGRKRGWGVSRHRAGGQRDRHRLRHYHLKKHFRTFESNAVSHAGGGAHVAAVAARQFCVPARFVGGFWRRNLGGEKAGQRHRYG